MKNKFFSWLPWPGKSKNHDSVIGLALFYGQVTGIRLRFKQGNWVVSRRSMRKVSDEQQLGIALGKVLEELTRVPAPCNLVLPAHLYQVLQMEKPELPENELVQSLPWLAKDLCAVAPENMVADYIDSPAGSSLQSKRISVFVADKNQLAPLLKPIHKKDHALQSIMPEEVALAHLLDGDEFAHLLVTKHAGQEPAIIIVKQGLLMLVRRLRGFNAFGQATDEQTRTALVENLSLEVQRSMDFYESQLKQAPIKDIQVAICGENDDEIADKLADYQAVKVMSMRPSIALSEVVEPDYYVALAAAQQLTEAVQ